MRWLGLFTNKTFRKHCKLIFPHRDFIICIVSLAIFHPHFFIRTFSIPILSSPSAIRHPPPPETSSRLCSRSIPWAFDWFWLTLWTKTGADNTCELFTRREGCFRSDADRFRNEFFSAVFSKSQRSNRRTFEKKTEYPNRVVLVICPLIGLFEDQIKEGQPLSLTCASLQDVNYFFSDNPLPRLLFASSEEALANGFGIRKDRPSKVPQQVELIVVDEPHIVEIWTG